MSESKFYHLLEKVKTGKEPVVTGQVLTKDQYMQLVQYVPLAYSSVLKSRVEA